MADEELYGYGNFTSTSHDSLNDIQGSSRSKKYFPEIEGYEEFGNARIVSNPDLENVSEIQGYDGFGGGIATPSNRSRSNSNVSNGSGSNSNSNLSTTRGRSNSISNRSRSNSNLSAIEDSKNIGTSNDNRSNSGSSILRGRSNSRRNSSRSYGSNNSLSSLNSVNSINSVDDDNKLNSNALNLNKSMNNTMVSVPSTLLGNNIKNINILNNVNSAANNINNINNMDKINNVENVDNQASSSSILTSTNTNMINSSNINNNTSTSRDNIDGDSTSVCYRGDYLSVSNPNNNFQAKKDIFYDENNKNIDDKNGESNKCFDFKGNDIMNQLSKYMSYLIFKLSTGTMYALSVRIKKQHSVIRFVDALLRGCGQVFLINNPITGLFILIGIALHSWQLLCCGFLGVASSTLTAYALKLDQGPIEAGLYGYNGILTGIGLATFSFGLESSEQIIFPIIFVASLSTIFTAALGNVTVTLLGIPPLTLPFQLATWLWLLSSQTTFSYYPTQFPNPSLNILKEVPFDEQLLTYPTIDIIKAIFTNISQVYLIEDYKSGLLMLIGIGFASPIASFFAIIGSVVAILISMSFGVVGSTVYAGLMGYNAVLVSICIGGLFYVLTTEVAFLSIFAAASSVMVSAGVGSGLSPIGMPALTFPFVLTTWLFTLLGNSTNAFLSVPLRAVTLPEHHLSRFVSSKLVIKTIMSFLQDTSLLSDVENYHDLNKIESDYFPSLMCHLAADGDVYTIKQILSQYPEYMKRSRMDGDYDGRTPLMLATANSQLQVMKYIINLGVDVMEQDLFGETALHDAIRKKNIKATELLVNSGAKVDIINFVDELLFAASRNEMDYVNVLVVAGVPVNSVDDNNRSALHLASSFGHLQLCKHLIHLYYVSLEKDDLTDHSSQPTLWTYQDKFGNSPRDDALSHGHQCIVEFYDQMEKEKEMKGTGSPYGLHNNNYQSINEYDHSDHSSNGQGTIIDETHRKQRICEKFQAILLCSAAKHGEEQEILKLVSNFQRQSTMTSSSSSIIMDIESRKMKKFADYDDRTPLHHAAAHDNVNMIDYLITNAGVAINHRDRWNRTPLWEAILYEKRESAAFLLTYEEAKVGLNDQQCFQYLLSLIHKPYSASKWSILVLARGFNVNACNYDGQNALHKAVQLNKLAAIEQLLQLGINIHTRDRWGNKPKNLTTNIKIIQLLR